MLTDNVLSVFKHSTHLRLYAIRPAKNTFFACLQISKSLAGEAKLIVVLANNKLLEMTINVVLVLCQMCLCSCYYSAEEACFSSMCFMCLAEKREGGEENSTLEPAEEGEERDEPKPRALHKTLSLFLRNLAPTITKQEVESVGANDAVYSLGKG